MSVSLPYIGVSVSETGEEAYLNTWADADNDAFTALDQFVGREQFPLLLKSPEDGDYPIVINIRHPGTLHSLTYKLVGTSPTATIATKIDATAATMTGPVTTVTGSDTSEHTILFTANRTFVAGDSITITLSAVANVDFASLNIWFDRTGAGTV